MKQDSCPEYLYKIISRKQWEESKGTNQIILSAMDRDFIHLAKKDQLPRILQKFWNNSDSIILKLVVKDLEGRLAYETNPGGTTKFYHLYDGNIPLEAVKDATIVCQGEIKRCFGGGPGKELYAKYHDFEWGIPVHDDRHLFEMLILEGAQAGLSWETILKRRDGYRKAFHRFDPKKVASMTDQELDSLLQDEGIIRNRLKVYAARQNAQVFLKIQKEFGSFDSYVWGFVEGKPKINHWKRFKDVPVTTPESDALSKDLKKRGMTFVGSTIIYAYMQAVGLINDHLADCWCREPQK